MWSDEEKALIAAVLEGVSNAEARLEARVEQEARAVYQGTADGYRKALFISALELMALNENSENALAQTVRASALAGVIAPDEAAELVARIQRGCVAFINAPRIEGDAAEAWSNISPERRAHWVDLAKACVLAELRASLALRGAS